ncbi:universal stress protein [Paucilactobacillus nenjiangensis]|uniref:Universal stress protein n=1 Tax=Paucilactobacillus nenjiangensis TaxID=1296540 RepID=A0A5P1WXP4_9LACO|nr:universal stress protein [Paucilactobacillus nenjiangensis]QER66430.1 universal stress protein [Paucilactobacillus nenjiangensis]
MDNKLSLDIEPKHFHTVLVGVDESHQGYVALANAIHQASEDSAKLVIASILELGDLSTFDAMSIPVIREKEDELQKHLDRYKEYALSQGLTDVETIVGNGSKAGAVLVQDLIPETNADLIIIGAHSKDGFLDYLGSQAVYVARNAKISSMIAR